MIFNKKVVLKKYKIVAAIIGISIPILISAVILFINTDSLKNLFNNKEGSTSTAIEVSDTIDFNLNLKRKSSISFNDGVYIPPEKEQHLPIKARLINKNLKEEVPVEIAAKKIDRNNIAVSLDPKKSEMIPGYYILEIEYEENGTTKTFIQDFSWGVLALNTNKPVYKPGETAKISIGVLDQNGSMVCDADVTLKITGPKRSTTTLKTNTGGIFVNPGCHVKKMILDPDFQSMYQTNGPGSYNMQLTATTQNGTHTVSDTFEVAEEIPYEIERITATRIYPKADYPVVIKIKANQDFRGKIEEKIPQSYKVRDLKTPLENIVKEPLSGGQISGFDINQSENDTKTIIWDADLKQGNTYYLSYEYDAPNKSPDFHLLGPLKIGDFSETRQWQIAVDDISIIDVHSSPEEGEQWIVRFETNGKHDLKIIPNDQATIEDDEFVSLSCDGEERTPQILEGDVIFYPDWECLGTSRVVHNTLKAGVHTLRFEFGDAVAYAYNSIWKIGWDYRKSLTFTGSTGGAQTDYVMRVRTYYGSGTDTSDQVYCSSNCESDFGDIRFTASDGTTDLSYWLQTYTDGTSATFWVEVDSIPASPSTSNIYMYYGNSSASTTSSGSDTFLFFDDFSDDLSQWTIDPQNTDDKVYIYNSAGNPSPSLRHDPDSTQTKNSYFDTRLATSSYTFQDGIIEYELYLAGSARIIHQFGWRVPGVQFGSGYCWRLQNSASDGGHLEFTGLASWATRGTSYPAVSGSTWHSVKEVVSGSNYTGYVNGGSGYSASDSTTLGANYLISHVHGVSLTSASYALVDNVRTRKYVSPEPTYTSWGSQETPVIDIAGTAYTDDDEGTTLDGVSICAAVDSTFTPGDCDTTSSGVFDIQDVAVSGQGSQPITLFVDGGSTFGNVITNHYVDNITGLKLYQNHIYLDYFTGDSISIVDMDAYDNDQNSTDMLYDATDSSPDTLTWESGIELYVPSGKEFIPGGNVNGHDIEIDGTWTAASGETINVDGSFKLDSGGSYTNAGQTLTFDGGSGTEDLITEGSGNIYNLVVNDAGGSLTVEVEDPLTIENNLTITNGTLDVVSGENNQINIAGDWTNDDIFEPRNGSVVFDGPSDANLDSGCADENTCTNEDFYNLTIQKQEDAQITLSSTNLRVTNLFEIVKGVFNQGALNVRAEGTTAIDVKDQGRYRNSSTGNLTLGGNLVNNGELTLNSNGMSCGDADSITIASTTTSQRSWSGQGGFRIADVSVSYQTGSAVIYAGSSTDSGNNGTNWRFVECNESLFEGINFEGLEVD